MLNSDLDFWLPIFSAPLDIPHEQGRLILDSSSIHTELKVVEIAKTPHYSDTMRLQRRLADRDGVVHIAESWISAEDIWDMIAGQFAYDESTYKRCASGFPRRSNERLHTLIDGALIEGDENGWVFCWRRALQPGLWSQVPCYARNKAFSARLDLSLSLTRQRSDGAATPWFHARVRPSRDHGVLGFEQLEAEGPDVTTDEQHLTTGDLWFEVPATRLVWRPGLRRCDRPIGGPEWREHPRDPIIFRDAGTTSPLLNANEGVYLETH